jgi:2,4-dienoyl-CoA reductase-like NADH-dependent reductase (Old Yellow Enzyme family)
MKYFTYKTLTELQRSAEAVGASHVRFEADPEQVKAALARRVQVGGVTVGNSIAIHPMEGCDGTTDGRPDTLVWRRYERFGRGGAKLIWVEATAVCPEGRANTRQLLISPDTIGDLAHLHELTRRAHIEEYGTDSDLLMPIQLTHSGRYSVPKKIIAYHSPLIDQKTNTPPDYPIISDERLMRLEDEYVEAAKLAWNAGYRAIEVKATHGYLVNELLGAVTRPGPYGGSLENRSRLLLNVVGKIRNVLGSQVILCVRLGCFDGVPYARDLNTGVGVPLPYSLPYGYGFGVDPADPLRENLDEVKTVIGWLRDAGVQLVNVSLGCPYYDPHVTRPFEKPDEGNYEEPEHPLLGVNRHFRIAGELQRTFPDLAIVGSGYSWLQIYAINAGAKNIMDGNIRFFGIGRNSLAYPDFARDALTTGVLDERRVCKTLTFCTFLMRQKNHPLGQFETGCPPFDKGVYGPVIKLARDAKRRAESPAVVTPS